MPDPFLKTAATGPLAGVRIVEIDAIGPVPLAAMLLADMGAEIVRVARPPSAGAGAWDDVGGDILHRSRTVTYLNLKDADDREHLLTLIGKADALIEGYRPGVMERLGLGPDICLARNPALVFGRMTGWGQTGPLALRAGHDINYLSITGALHAMGDGESPPPVPLNLVGDYGGGAMFLIAGLLAAILSARATGTGQVVDACITDGVPSLMSLFYAWQPKGLWSDAPASNLLDGGAPFYRCYRCADGRDVAVGCLEPQFFAQMIAGLGLEDRGYNQNERAEWPRMEADFSACFATRPRDEWAALFADTDACVTPVLSMAEAPLHPHNTARATFVRHGAISQPAPSPRFSGTPGSIAKPESLTIEAALGRWS
ncbi:MAG: carnitine dehydratase [Novosphingobium sp. 32-60-15]|uniref:CaiB/BaiF CoA transferase family protein n=1 Tax=unclassified Novosphingobium TaxID=2644732 RepID=UPI000BC8FA04|nr:MULTISPECIES: CaiB/BaiF CoA-transferase family protein [unclassified Novosphingobium]OYX64522.1 MAG: carnitine dehydratase [Novosphingobium sp. 32-60-15]